MPLPTLDKESDLQTLIRGTNMLSSLVQRVELQEGFRIVRGPFQQVANPLGFSDVNLCHFCTHVKILSKKA